MGTDPKSTSAGTEGYFNTDHLKSGLRTRALRGVSLTLVSQSSAFALQTIGTIILARLLTPDDFGSVSMVLAFSLLLQNLGCNGFTEVVVQTKEIHHRQVSTLFWINFGLSLLLTLFFLAMAPVIAWFYKQPVLSPIAAVLSVSILLGGLPNQHLGLLTRDMQFLKTSANEALSALLSLGVSIGLAWYGWGYWALVAKWIVAPLAVTIGAWSMCAWRPCLPARGTGARPLLRFAFNTYGNFAMSYFRRNIDKMLIGRFYGAQSLGYYDRAYHLSNMLPIQILSPLYSVAIATFSRLSDDHEKYSHTYLKVLSILAFVGMPLSAIITLNSYDLIFLLLGPQWHEAGRILSAFGPSIGIAIIYITHGWLHLSLGTPDRWFRWSILEFVITLLCFLVGLAFGAFGVAVAFSASFYILAGPGLWYAGRPIRLRMSAVVGAVYKYYTAALGSGLVCLFFTHFFTPTSAVFSGFGVPTRIVLSTILSICIYIVLLIAIFMSLRPIFEFVSILREMVLASRRSGA